MTPTMRKSMGLVVLCLLAGCGGDDKSTTTSSQPSGQSSAAVAVTSQDALAKAGARILSTYVEACYAENQDYSGCTTAETLGATEVKLGSGPGQVEVTDADATGYRIVSHSESGNTYEIAKTDQGTTRTCGADTATSACVGGTW